MCRLMFAVTFAILIAIPGAAQSQKSDSDQDKAFDVRSTVGDLHLGSDADARKIGLPLYPGARLKLDDEKQSQANLSIFTEAFGFKLVIANYESDDAAGKIIGFYRDKLKKYGKVLECHSQKHGGDVDVQQRLDLRLGVRLRPRQARRSLTRKSAFSAFPFAMDLMLGYLAPALLVR